MVRSHRTLEMGFARLAGAATPLPSPGSIQYGLLGPTVAYREDGPVDLGPPLTRSALVVLMVARGTTVGIDRIIDALWGEHPPPTARHAVHAAISQLRGALGSASIRTIGDGYALTEAVVDVDEATALIDEAREALDSDPETALDLVLRALTLWRGEPLADVAYAEWAQPEIRRIDEIHLGALSVRLRALVALGRHEEAIPDLEALVLQHPFMERLWALLIIALCRAGRTAEALGAFREAERHLVESFGISPSPRLRELRDRVLCEDPGLLDAWSWDADRHGAHQQHLFEVDGDVPASGDRAAQ